jgi:hypothetical protein
MKSVKTSEARKQAIQSKILQIASLTDFTNKCNKIGRKNQTTTSQKGKK